jgi:Tfp pilus assembly protein PilF
MKKLKQLILTIGCLLILGGCVTAQQKNNNEIGTQPESEDPHMVDVKKLYQLGREYHQKNEYAEAINAYEKVIELTPDHYEAYNNLGVIYSTLGKDELGIKSINQAVRLAPLISYLHNNLGYALLKQGRSSEAVGAFERALQLDSENLHARNNLESAYKQMGCSQGQPCGQWQEPR